MDVLLKISGAQKHGERATMYGLGQIDIDPKYVAEEFTLAELNMLRTHLATFDAVLEGAIQERNEITSHASLRAKGLI